MGCSMSIMHVITKPRFLIILVWLYSFKISAKKIYLYIIYYDLKTHRGAAFTAFAIGKACLYRNLVQRLASRAQALAYMFM